MTEEEYQELLQRSVELEEWNAPRLGFLVQFTARGIAAAKEFARAEDAIREA